MTFNKKLVIISVLGLVVFLFDRFLKYVFLQGHEYTLINDVLSFKIFGNTGIAFGIRFVDWIFYILVVVILVFLIYFIVKFFKKKQVFQVGVLWFVILGAASNLIDRVRYGYVVDYIDFWKWSVFNVADIMIVVSILVFFGIMFKETKKPEKKLTK